MLTLSNNGIKNREDWKKAGIELPGFNIDKMVYNTMEAPTWVHFGAGNILKGFIAVLQHKLIEQNRADSGIIAAETYDSEIIDRIYKPYDNLSLLVLMRPDGSLEKRVIASIADSIDGDSSKDEDWAKLKDIFTKPSLQIVSFTITEKGYGLKGISGEYLADVKDDIDNGPDKPRHTMSKIASLAYNRYLNGGHAIAFVSMDNCSQNGEKLQTAVCTIAGKWAEKGFVDKKFLEYLNDPSKVSFPWTMIDKITPRPSEKVRDALMQAGFGSADIVCTQKKTYIAPFVNAEVPQYLVVEDKFPNGRMSLEQAGVIFTDRETVNRVEKMKVGTCLNPLHTALAIFGCILGYTLIADEMKDEHLRALVEKIGYVEGMPVVVHPGILDPEEFIREVIEVRFPNPYIPDTPQRIATDTSQKMPVRFGETIKSYVLDPKMDVRSLKYIPLTIAGWCRYLMGIDDKGDKVELSSDPMMGELQGYLKDVEFGNPSSVKDHLVPILSNERLFGQNLYEIGLGEKIEGYFKDMIAGVHAVRKVLKEALEG
ncbi:MAG: mannitol dehydrogenase family protein [Clostridiaceae bacterium]|nr:mannitol dehydrogenase family protein [Clostridiaceae bacterium]